MRPVREYSQFDENGNLVFTHTTTVRKVHRNYAIFFVTSLRDFIAEVPNLMTMRLFMQLASKQAFSKGVAVTTEKLAEDLKCSRQSIQSAKRWLIEHNYLKMVKREGVTCWWLNPDVTTRGFKNYQQNLAEWRGLKDEKDIGNGESATILSTEPEKPDVVLYNDFDDMDNTV